MTINISMCKTAFCFKARCLQVGNAGWDGMLCRRQVVKVSGTGIRTRCAGFSQLAVRLSETGSLKRAPFTCVRASGSLFKASDEIKIKRFTILLSIILAYCNYVIYYL